MQEGERFSRRTTSTGSLESGVADAGLTTLMVRPAEDELGADACLAASCYSQSSSSGKTAGYSVLTIASMVSFNKPSGRGNWIACCGHDAPNCFASMSSVYFVMS